MRMVSLTDHDAVIKQESIQDTVEDIINYSTYWLQFKEEEAAKSVTRPVQRDFEPNFCKPTFEKLSNLKKKAEHILTGNEASKLINAVSICVCQDRPADSTHQKDDTVYCNKCEKVVATFG